MRILSFVLLAGFAAPALASTPAAWTALDRQVASACVKKAGLARARTLSDKVGFSDAIPVELRIVQGFNSRGKYARLLCAYDRRTKQVEVQDVTGRLGAVTR